MIHSYPAIINIVIGGVEVRFPDFKCSRKFVDLDHALYGAKEHLAYLVNFLGKDIKTATSMHYIKTKDNEFIVMINFDDEEKYHSYITDLSDVWITIEEDISVIDKNNRVYNGKKDTNNIEKCAKNFKADSSHPTNNDELSIEYLKGSYTINTEIDKMLTILEDNYKRDLLIKDINILMNIQSITCENETYIDADRYDDLHPQLIGLMTSYTVNTDLIFGLRCYKVKDILDIYKGC